MLEAACEARVMCAEHVAAERPHRPHQVLDVNADGAHWRPDVVVAGVCDCSGPASAKACSSAAMRPCIVIASA